VVRRHVVHGARSSVTLSWFAPTLDGGATIVTHVIQQSRAPVTDVDASRAGQATDGRRSTTNSASASKVSRSARPTAVRSFSRPTADGHGDSQDSTSPVVQSLYGMIAVTFSFRFGKGHSASQIPVTFTSIRSCRQMPATSTTFGQFVNSAECLFTLLVLSRMRFYCYVVIIERVLLNFACHCLFN